MCTKVQGFPLVRAKGQGVVVCGQLAAGHLCHLDASLLQRMPRWARRWASPSHLPSSFHHPTASAIDALFQEDYTYPLSTASFNFIGKKIIITRESRQPGPAGAKGFSGHCYLTRPQWHWDLNCPLSSVQLGCRERREREGTIETAKLRKVGRKKEGRRLPKQLKTSGGIIFLP